MLGDQSTIGIECEIHVSFGLKGPAWFLKRTPPVLLVRVWMHMLISARRDCKGCDSLWSTLRWWYFLDAHLSSRFFPLFSHISLTFPRARPAYLDVHSFQPALRRCWQSAQLELGQGQLQKRDTLRALGWRVSGCHLWMPRDSSPIK